MCGANKVQSELSRAWIQAGSSSAVVREVSATRRAGSLLARPCSRLARRRRAASSEPGSCSPAPSRRSPVSGETSLSCARRARLASCSARPRTPPAGMYVCLSHARTEAAEYTSLIVARRSLSSRRFSFAPSVITCAILASRVEPVRGWRRIASGGWVYQNVETTDLREWRGRDERFAQGSARRRWRGGRRGAGAPGRFLRCTAEVRAVGARALPRLPEQG